MCSWGSPVYGKAVRLKGKYRRISSNPLSGQKSYVKNLSEVAILTVCIYDALYKNKPEIFLIKMVVNFNASN